jgi:CMP-N,N'-diacetyllegionaminic acid synthase
MWPVLQHALTAMESQDRYRYGSVLLLFPTSPARLPEDVSMAMQLLEQDSHEVGVVAACKPPSTRDGPASTLRRSYMRQSFPDGNVYTKRQDVPAAVYHINGALYLWRRDHVADSEAPLYFDMPHRMLEIPEGRAIDIDSPRDFRLAELMLRDGMVRFPWL